MFMGIVAFIILIPIVVFVHEFGHFITAKLYIQYIKTKLKKSKHFVNKIKNHS